MNSPKSIAQDNLLPDGGYLNGDDEYSMMLKVVFNEGLTENTILRVMVIPSFSPEYMTGVWEKSGIYEAFVLEPTSVIWDPENPNLAKVEAPTINENKNNSITLSKTPSNEYGNKIEVNVIKKEITKKLAARLESIWKSELTNVKNAKKPPLTIDGTSYFFSAKLDKQETVSGKIVSAKKGSKMGALLDVVRALVMYSRNEIDQVTLEEIVANFEKFKYTTTKQGAHPE
jgi:hypothetical protein